MSDRIQSEWFAATLEDALETLEEAVRLLREDPRKAQGVLEHEVTLTYAKLNYAVNTAYDVPPRLRPQKTTTNLPPGLSACPLHFPPKTPIPNLPLKFKKPCNC